MKQWCPLGEHWAPSERAYVSPLESLGGVTEIGHCNTAGFKLPYSWPSNVIQLAFRVGFNWPSAGFKLAYKLLIDGQQLPTACHNTGFSWPKTYLQLASNCTTVLQITYRRPINGLKQLTAAYILLAYNWPSAGLKIPYTCPRAGLQLTLAFI